MHWSLAVAIELIAIGFGVGFFGTLIGAGGGFILTPILLVLYPDESATTITTISLAVVFFNAASGSAAYWRQKRIDFQSGKWFALATLPGSIVGVFLVGFVSRSVFNAVTAVVLTALAVWLVLGERWPLRVPQNGLVHRSLTDRTGEVYEYDVPLKRGVVYSVGVGLVSSFLGIGGGVIHVPLMVRALGFPTHVATATSHFVLAIMSGTATVVHLSFGAFAHGARRVLALGAGVIGGAQLGAHVSLRLRGAVIQWLLAAALVALSLRLLIGM